MTDTHSFPTLGIISVTTGIMFSQIGDIYEICGFVLGDPGVMTHQLPAASRAATVAIFEQHPELVEVGYDVDQSDPDWRPKFQQACDDLEEMFGKTMELEPAKDPQWESGRALQDLVEMMGGTDKPVIVVTTA